MDDLNRVRELAGLPLTESYNVEDNNQVNEASWTKDVGSDADGLVKTTEEEAVGEAGGYYTQPVYDMIEKHGYEKVMAELLLKLDANVIQDFLNRADFDESIDEGETKPKFVFTVINSNTLLIVNNDTGEQRYANNVTLPSLYDVTQAQLAKLFKTGTHSNARS